MYHANNVHLDVLIVLILNIIVKYVEETEKELLNVYVILDILMIEKIMTVKNVKHLV